MLKLRVNGNKHNAIWLVEPKVTLGRAPGNDMMLDDASVADRHAEILVNYEKLTLVNLSGGSSLRVNGAAVSNSCELQANDKVTLGRVELQVIDPKRRTFPAAGVGAAATSAWSLKANHSALSSRVFKLKDVTLVGRSNECDITLAASHLSRRHAQLQVKDNLLYVRDLGSANGTYLNGRRITQARVRRGDELCFDTIRFGVIGPADDLDKTTVRTITPMSQSKRPPQYPPQIGQQHPHPGQHKAPTGAGVMARMGNHARGGGGGAAAIDLREKRSGAGSLLIVTVLVAATVAIWFAYQRGLF